MRQAIITKFLPPTNFKGSRIKAMCERGHITIPWDHALGTEKNHKAAVAALITKFLDEDKAENLYDVTNPWSRPHSFGWLPGGGAVAVYPD